MVSTPENRPSPSRVPRPASRHSTKARRSMLGPARSSCPMSCGLREAEVVGPGEELACAVEAAGGEQLFGTDDPQLRAELRTDEILATLAAGERQVGGLHAHPARENRQELRVLVVGVRADHEYAFVGTQLGQRARQRRDAAGAGRGELSRSRADGAKKESEASPERAPHYGETYVTPPFITNRTRSSSETSFNGSPDTATRSAAMPGATAPTSAWPKSSAASDVPDLIACIGVMPYCT